MNPNLVKAKAAKAMARQRRLSICRRELLAAKTRGEARPKIKDICKLYAVHTDTATNLINEVFGNQAHSRSHKVREFLGTLDKRPMCKTVAQKFGITNQCAGWFIRQKWGVLIQRSSRKAVSK